SPATLRPGQWPWFCTPGARSARRRERLVSRARPNERNTLSLRWFRFGKKPEDAVAQDVAAAEVPEPTEAPTTPEPTEGAPDRTRKRRRRGSRGGRGRKKPGGETAATVAGPPEEVPNE